MTQVYIVELKRLLEQYISSTAHADDDRWPSILDSVSHLIDYIEDDLKNPENQP